jgi:hypothetical protein
LVLPAVGGFPVPGHTAAQRDRCQARYYGRGPQIEFHEGDAHPGDNSFWVNAKDQLSLSLLQARLIDLGMPY